MCEVTSSNFSELFPSIIQQIDESCFLSIDTEFSSIDTQSFLSKTINQYYKQRSDFVKQITIFQFGLAIFSNKNEQELYQVNIYNFYLKPTSIYPVDVTYKIQSSSIKFLSEYKFDFNKCFYFGIPFLNQTQEQTFDNKIQTSSNFQYSINETEFLNGLFEKINNWLITARIGDSMEYEFIDNKQILDDYLIHYETCRCFKTVWTNVKFIDNRKILFIERVTKDFYEQNIQDDKIKFQLYLESLIGFSKLIRYIRDNYRKPIIGHNCFLDWLIIYDKFLDVLPSKFEQFRYLFRKDFSSSFYDTKYLANEMKNNLFKHQNGSMKNLTALTSLSSLYNLLTSKFYDNFIFFKPNIEIISIDRYKNQVWTHEAGYDAYMSGVIFLKLIYLYRQKQCENIEFNHYHNRFDIYLNHIQIFKNRFYSTFIPYISLNHNDQTNIILKKQFQYCLVVKKHDKQKLDTSDIISRFSSYCSMHYEINKTSNEIYLLFQSEKCQQRILEDYTNHPLYHVEKYMWLKHSLFMKYSFGMSIFLTGIVIFFLVKR